LKMLRRDILQIKNIQLFPADGSQQYLRDRPSGPHGLMRRLTISLRGW